MTENHDHRPPCPIHGSVRMTATEFRAAGDGTCFVTYECRLSGCGHRVPDVGPIREEHLAHYLNPDNDPPAERVEGNLP